ncbi:MAG: sulfatase, partial [Acidobacteriota bacterium]
TRLTAGRTPLPAGLARLRLRAGGEGGAMLHGATVRAPAPSAERAPSTAAGPSTEPPAAVEAGSPGSIILYSIDTLRADVLELYGGPVPTPALRRFAAGAVIFDGAVSQSSWTKASMASVLTGLAPPVHGALSRRHVLAPERVTLQEMLSAAGYQTAAFNTNPNLTRAFGFDQGFDFFVDLPETATAGDVLEEVRAWLARDRDPSRPLFLWVHTLDPHSPYAPPEAARERWAAGVDPRVAADSRYYLDGMRAGRIPRDEGILDDLRRLYQAEAAYSDEVFGRFLDLFEANDLGDAALLVLSDHGEEFYEHGNLEHGRSLFEESVHVPMLLRLPGLEPARVEPRVQHLDVMPTLLEWAGVEVPRALPGRSLLEVAAGAGGPNRVMWSHLHLDGAERAALYGPLLKLTAERRPDGRLGRFLLFDLDDDPGELRDLSAERPLERGWLAHELRRSLAIRQEAAEIDLDSETRRRLEALGYL